MTRPGRAAGRVSPAALVTVLMIALFVVFGMGVAEAHLAVPCYSSAIFGAAGDHGRGFCHALKASMLGPVLVGELVLLFILLVVLAAAKARIHDRILGTAAGLRVAGMAGVVLLLAVNTPIMTSSMILAGCTVQQPPGETGTGKDAAWLPGECRISPSVHPVLFERETKKTHDDYFDLRDAKEVQRLVLA